MGFADDSKNRKYKNVKTNIFLLKYIPFLYFFTEKTNIKMLKKLMHRYLPLQYQEKLDLCLLYNWKIRQLKKKLKSNFGR